MPFRSPGCVCCGGTPEYVVAFAFARWNCFFGPFAVMHWGGPEVGFDYTILNNVDRWLPTRYRRYRNIAKGKTVLAELEVDGEYQTTVDLNNGVAHQETFGNMDDWGIVSSLGDNFGNMTGGFSSETGYGYTYEQGVIEWRLELPVTYGEIAALSAGYLAGIDLASEPVFSGYTNITGNPDSRGPLRHYIVRPPSRLGAPLPAGVDGATCRLMLMPNIDTYPWDGTFLVREPVLGFDFGTAFKCDLRTQSPGNLIAARGFPVNMLWNSPGRFADYTVDHSSSGPFIEATPGALWRARNYDEGNNLYAIMTAKSRWFLPAGLGCSRIARDVHIQPFNASSGIVEAAHCGGVDISPGAADLAASGNEWIHAGNFPLGSVTTCCS